MTTEEKIRQHFLDVMADHTGLKATELTAKVTEAVYTNAQEFNSGDINLPVTKISDKIIEVMNAMIESGDIIEIDYAVPTMDWRIKSFLLPKDSKIIHITGQGKTLPISDADFEKLAHWASVSRTLNQTIRLLNNYMEALDSHERNTSTQANELAEDAFANISELKELRNVFNNLNDAAKQANFLLKNRQPEGE
jgi:hypothetical protein